MTIEEAKQMATQGDIRAMCSLGDFYIKQNTGEGIREASKWYELAARKNVIYAIHITVLSKKILAYSDLQVVAGSEKSEKIDIKQALENYNDAIYYRKSFLLRDLFV